MSRCCCRTRESYQRPYRNPATMPTPSQPATRYSWPAGCARPRLPRAWSRIRLECPACHSATLQEPRDRDDRAPAPRRDRHAKQLFKLAQVSDGFHLTAADAEHEATLTSNNPDAPVAVGRDVQRHVRKSARRCPGQNTHELQDGASRGLTLERVAICQAQDVAAVTDDHVGFERQPADELVSQLRAADLPADDKRPRGTNVHDLVPTERLREELRAKPPVPSDIDALEKNNQRH